MIQFAPPLGTYATIDERTAAFMRYSDKVTRFCGPIEAIAGNCVASAPQVTIRASAAPEVIHTGARLCAAPCEESGALSVERDTRAGDSGATDCVDLAHAH